MTEKKITPQQKYHAVHKKRYVLDCFDTSESDIINHLEKQQNKAGYIKNLIREDIKKLSN